MEAVEIEAALAPFRALDLTNQQGPLCGKILGDLGADVLKVEPPAGDFGRRLGPFLHGVPGPERSLSWLAYNTSKRSITLNLETREGQDILRRLVTRADFLIESFPPGYLSGLGLGYDDLAALNPRLIMVSITPYGQTGPFHRYAACDLTLLASGGLLYLCGDEDRPPVRIGVEQAYNQAGAQAALACMIAHQERARTGLGQYVDVSIQECVANTLVSAQPEWEIAGLIQKRGSRLPYGDRVVVRVIWPCQDGFVAWKLYVGRNMGNRNLALFQWMAEEGFSPELLDVDWEGLTTMQLEQGVMDAWESKIGRFLLTKTKRELYHEALRRRIMLFPVNDPRELLENDQLRARGFWVTIEHPELETAITYPGPAVVMHETPLRVGRPPRLGEHNVEIYHGELGFSLEDLGVLRASGII